MGVHDRPDSVFTIHQNAHGDKIDQSAEHVVASQAKCEVDALLIAPLQSPWGARNCGHREW
jgi:hypothetical protein